MDLDELLVTVRQMIGDALYAPEDRSDGYQLQLSAWYRSLSNSIELPELTELPGDQDPGRVNAVRRRSCRPAEPRCRVNFLNFLNFRGTSFRPPTSDLRLFSPSGRLAV